MIRIKQTGNRNRLFEGKSRGLGFAFCKKIDDEVFETIAPISACKDYLNDQVYTEQTGKPVVAYGLATQKLDLFKDRAYIVATILPNQRTNSRYDEMDFDIRTLDSNINNIVSLLNYVETQFEIPKEKQTVMLRDDNNCYLLSLPLYWVKYQYLISLYTFFVRMGMFYNGKESVEHFLNEGFLEFVPRAVEFYHWKTNPIRSRYLHLRGIKDHYFDADLAKLGTGESIHNNGESIHNKGFQTFPDFGKETGYKVVLDWELPERVDPKTPAVPVKVEMLSIC